MNGQKPIKKVVEELLQLKGEARGMGLNGFKRGELVLLLVKIRA